MKVRMMMIALICTISLAITAVSVLAGVLGVPFDGTHPITQGFNDIGIGTNTPHKAIDYAMPEGTLLYARKSGSISVIVDNQPNNWNYETDKPYGENIGLARWQYSGTHHRVVHGIGVETLLWTDNLAHIPIDYRIYDKPEDGYTKNQHFQEMIRLASHRGFRPQGVLMDAWYSTVANLKTLDSISWLWITELQANRNVSLEPHKYCRVDSLDIPGEGLTVHLKNYGFIKVFKITAPKGRVGYFTTSDQSKTQKDIRDAYSLRWKIEEYHRGLKQATGIERCQARKSRIQRNHVLCSTLAFVALEVRRLNTGTSWYQSKREIINHALAAYLKKPFISLPQPSTA